MSKIKVLEVAFPALNNSGVPAVIMGIVRELHSDVAFDLLAFRKEVGYHEQEFLSYGGKIHHIDCDKTGNKIKDIVEKIVRPWRLYTGTRKILRLGHYDAIHCHNGFDSCWCILAAKKEKVPVRVVHSHRSINEFEKGNTIIKLYEFVSKAIINRNTTDRIGCSQAACEYMYGKNIPSRVIVNAVDTTRFNPSAYPIKKYDKGRPSFVFVGRLCEEKNPEFLMELFNAVLTAIPQATLTIVGFGPLEDMVRSKVKQYNMERSVTLLAHSSDIPQVLANSDFFLMPSLFEGLGIVLIEAQSMGVYAFASDKVPRESDMGLCEYITICNGVDIWKQRIIDVIQKYDDRRLPDMDALHRYDWTTVSKEYLELYSRNELT